MKLEKNMFVRTKRGITQYREYETNIGKLLCMPLLDGTFANIEDIIEEPSFNPIDLVQVGDYVNEIRVGYISKGENYFYALTNENTRGIICGYDSDGFTKPLNSILTKEQFEVNVYKMPK